MNGPLPLAVTMGDASGIGPEIVAKALAGSEPASFVTAIGYARRLAFARVNAHPFDRTS